MTEALLHMNLTSSSLENSEMKPSYIHTPRTLAECNFQPGYKTWNYSEEDEQAKSWVLILAVFFALLILGSVALSFIRN